MTCNVPRSNQDPFHRYKMPVLKAKVEGRGNGIKTVVTNLSEIAKALERPPEYPTKFFGFELGALTKCEPQADRWIVNGKREAEDLAKVLDTFIERFVLCSKCGNPETTMDVRRDSIILNCRACGATTPVEMTHRLSTYVLKNPPDGSGRKKTMTKAERREAKRRQAEGSAADDQDEDDDDDWCVPITPEAVSQRRLALLGGSDRLDGADDDDSSAPSTDDKAKSKRLVQQIKVGSNPIPVLSAFFASGVDDEEIVSQVRELIEANQWSESVFFKILFGSLFPKPFPTKDFVKKARIIRLFVTGPKQQKVVLFCVEKLCQMDSSAVALLPSILNCFWEESVIDEEVVYKWFKHPNKHLPPKLSAKVRQESDVFVKWLETAEEPEDFL